MVDYDSVIQQLFDKALRSYAREIGKYTVNESSNQESLCDLEARNLSRKLSLLI